MEPPTKPKTFATEEIAITKIKIMLPYLNIKSTNLLFPFVIETKILKPSNGAIGKQLKTAKLMLTIAQK